MPLQPMSCCLLTCWAGGGRDQQCHSPMKQKEWRWQLQQELVSCTIFPWPSYSTNPKLEKKLLVGIAENDSVWSQNLVETYLNFRATEFCLEFCETAFAQHRQESHLPHGAITVISYHCGKTEGYL